MGITIKTRRKDVALFEFLENPAPTGDCLHNTENNLTALLFRQLSFLFSPANIFSLPGVVH
jgi:hypothetical protein